jgi:hypothetical protein
MTTPTEAESATRPQEHSQGIGLTYKLATAVTDFIVGASLWLIGSTDLTEELNAAATIIRRHVSNRVGCRHVGNGGARIGTRTVGSSGPIKDLVTKL